MRVLLWMASIWASSLILLSFISTFKGFLKSSSHSLFPFLASSIACRHLLFNLNSLPKPYNAANSFQLLYDCMPSWMMTLWCQSINAMRHVSSSSTSGMRLSSCWRKLWWMARRDSALSSRHWKILSGAPSRPCGLRSLTCAPSKMRLWFGDSMYFDNPKCLSWSSICKTSSMLARLMSAADEPVYNLAESYGYLIIRVRFCFIEYWKWNISLKKDLVNIMKTTKWNQNNLNSFYIANWMILYD